MKQSPAIHGAVALGGIASARKAAPRNDGIQHVIARSEATKQSPPYHLSRTIFRDSCSPSAETL